MNVTLFQKKTSFTKLVVGWIWPSDCTLLTWLELPALSEQGEAEAGVELTLAFLFLGFYFSVGFHIAPFQAIT